MTEASVSESFFEIPASIIKPYSHSLQIESFSRFNSCK